MPTPNNPLSFLTEAGVMTTNSYVYGSDFTISSTSAATEEPAVMSWQPEQLAFMEAIQTVAPKSATNEEVLSRRIRDCFRVRPPTRINSELAEGIFSAQNISPSHPYPFEDHKSLIGIEVEVENVLKVDPNVLLAVWQMVPDHSLRNNGQEFKTLPIPLGYAQHALDLLFKGLNPDVDFSVRTSIHVHQDVRGLELGELLTLLFTYICFEPLLFKFAGNSRKTSIYCVPLGQTTLFDQFTEKKRFANALKAVNTWWPKYSALNLQPVASFGTVEYRHLPGTNNIGKILIWLDLLSRIKVWAYKNSLDSVMARISDLNTNSQYASLLNDVFGSAAQFLDDSDLLHDMESGVTAVRNCAITNDFNTNLDLDSGSPFALSCKQRSTSEFLTEEQEIAWQAYAKRWFPKENSDDLYYQVKRRLKDYWAHSGKEGEVFLRVVFPQ